MEPIAEYGLPTGMDLIRAERQRQRTSEGWTHNHDVEHGMARLLRAAEAYEWSNVGRWPWDIQWWKPKDVLRDLIRAGALYLAAQDVSPDAPPAGTHGAERCGQKIDGILATAHAILTSPLPPDRGHTDA